jgi:hypothetical protein
MSFREMLSEQIQERFDKQNFAKNTWCNKQAIETDNHFRPSLRFESQSTNLSSVEHYTGPQLGIL